jgi:hypothetical protein
VYSEKVKVKSQYLADKKSCRPTTCGAATNQTSSCSGGQRKRRIRFQGELVRYLGGADGHLVGIRGVGRCHTFGISGRSDLNAIRIIEHGDIAELLANLAGLSNLGLRHDKFVTGDASNLLPVSGAISLRNQCQRTHDGDGRSARQQSECSDIPLHGLCPVRQTILSVVVYPSVKEINPIRYVIQVLKELSVTFHAKVYDEKKSSAIGLSPLIF